MNMFSLASSAQWSHVTSGYCWAARVGNISTITESSDLHSQKF